MGVKTEKMRGWQGAEQRRAILVVAAVTSRRLGQRGAEGGANRAKKACLSLSYSPARRAQVTPSVQLE